MMLDWLEEGDDQEVCGESFEHSWNPGDPECRNCGADLSEWNEVDEVEEDMSSE